jgi:hypothetical protein
MGLSAVIVVIGSIMSAKLFSPRNVVLRILRDFHFRCQDGIKKAAMLREAG